jgi:hypothetical protein
MQATNYASSGEKFKRFTPAQLKFKQMFLKIQQKYNYDFCVHWVLGRWH